MFSIAKIDTSALITLSPQTPDEVSAYGTERRLTEERRHELVSVDLVHSSSQGTTSLV